MSQQTINEPDTQHHSEHMQQVLSDVAIHAREDIEKVDDPSAKALFETSAEVLGGLEKAFSDYESKTEPAWKKN